MFDYHIHTKFCNHAEGEMEEYVQAAIKSKLTEMGFSCHIPREFLPKEVPRELYAMTMNDFKGSYLPEINRLQKKYESEINIKTGLEIDYFAWIQTPILEFIEEYSGILDYIFGSVHILKTQNAVWSIDDHNFSKYYNQFGINSVYDQYLDAILELIHTGKYNILAHLDLPKKYGFRPTNSDRYYAKISEVLDEVKKQGMSLEVSTAGLRKFINEIYPDDLIVRMAIERDISLVTSSDSHRPEEVAYEFQKLYAYLRNLGVIRLVKYDKGIKKQVEID
jgi:histidinol-phosphatase (PHP family)